MRVGALAGSTSKIQFPFFPYTNAHSESTKELEFFLFLLQTLFWSWLQVVVCYTDGPGNLTVSSYHSFPSGDLDFRVNIPCVGVKISPWCLRLGPATLNYASCVLGFFFFLPVSTRRDLPALISLRLPAGM
jgi:hypothetical protein